ncbi:MAG: SPFH domain-containing protein [Planctomycetota bacterium]
MESSRNAYLEQVMVEQQQLENDLRVNKKMAPQAQMAQMAQRRVALPGQAAPPPPPGGGGAPSQPAGPAVDVRITGWWRWKNVIVPPNAYVVHTRRGKTEPVDIGMGISFGFDPVTDSFLVVPATMQTILINARSIVRERQGVLLQGYVQWIVEDFQTAYRKLDFSDPDDPMRVVNLQLREQAEAAIKDKVATMSIDEVLADKQPIIRELTARLKHLAEGDGAGEGLGLRIVTVQIKEAIVSSSTLWETLQRPFRALRSKEARLAELENESIVRRREAEEEKARSTEQIETQSTIAAKQARAQSEAYDRDQGEKIRRAKIEADSLAQRVAFEAERIAKEAELALSKLRNELEQAELRAEAAKREAEREIALEAARSKLENDITPTALQARLVEQLPEVMSKMPVAKELKAVTINGDGIAAITAGIARIGEALAAVRMPPKA